MAIPLKQSTASQVVDIGPFVDSTDGDTEETGLTIANTDIKLRKHSATSLVNKNSGGATHMSKGMYQLTLDATDTDTLGALTIYVHVAGALYATRHCVVMTATNYDAAIAGTGAAAANVTQWGGTAVASAVVLNAANIGADAITAAKIADNAIDAGSIASGALTAAKFAADTGLVPIRTGTAQAGASSTITLDAGASSVNGFYVGQIVRILSGTGAGQSAAIGAYVGSTKVATMGTFWATAPDNTSVFAILAFASPVAVSGNVVGSVASVTGNVAGTVNGLTATAQGNVRTAVGLASANLDTQLGAIDDFLDTEVAAILTIAQKLDTALELDGAVWRYTVNALENAPAGGGGGTADWTAGEKEQIRHRLGIDGTATNPSVGVPSLATQASVNTIDDFIDTEVSAIKAKTDGLPANPAASSDVPSAATIAATVRNELTTELGRLDAAISTRATPTQVNAEVLDVLSVDTHTLPAQGAPPASPDILTALLFLYKFLRNKQARTTTELRVYDDAGTTVDHKAAIADDGGTFTKNEFVAGP